VGRVLASSCCGPSTHPSTETDPIIIGQPNGDPAIQVTAILPVAGITPGDTAWVTGTGVAELLGHYLT
jgi:hypothetical protein